MALSPNERSVQGIFGFCIDYQEMRYRNTESRIVIPYRLKKITRHKKADSLH